MEKEQEGNIRRTFFCGGKKTEKEKEEMLGKGKDFFWKKWKTDNLHILHILHNQTPFVISFPKTYDIMGLLVVLVFVFVFS